MSIQWEIQIRYGLFIDFLVCLKEASSLFMINEAFNYPHCDQWAILLSMIKTIEMGFHISILLHHLCQLPTNNIVCSKWWLKIKI